MEAGSRVPLWLIGLLAILSAATFAWSWFGFILPFEAAAHQTMLETRIGGYEAADVIAMYGTLQGNAAALGLQLSMYGRSELFFPAFFAAFLFLGLYELRPGGAYFGRPLSPASIRVFYALPILYALSDYAENAVSYLAFTSAQAPMTLAEILPWLTRLKLLLVTLSLITELRFLLLRFRPGTGEE